MDPRRVAAALAFVLLLSENVVPFITEVLGDARAVQLGLVAVVVGAEDKVKRTDQWQDQHFTQPGTHHGGLTTARPRGGNSALLLAIARALPHTLTRMSCRRLLGVPLLVYCLGAFSNGFYISSRGSFVDTLANQTNSPLSTMGSYFLATGIGSAIVALPVGYATDKFDAHRVGIAGLGIRALGCSMIPFVSNFWELVVDTIAIGFSLPLVGVTLRACTLWQFGKGLAPSALNVVMGSYGAGSVLGPLLFGWLVQWDPLSVGPDLTGKAAMDLVNWVTVAVCCLAMLLAGLTKSPTHDKNEDAPSGAAANDGDSDDHSDHAKDDSMHLPAEEKKRRRRRSCRVPMVAVMSVYLGLSVGAECTIGGWLVSYARATGNFGVFQANVLASVLWIIFTATRFVMATLAICVHPGWFLLAGHICCVGGTVLLLSVSAPASTPAVWAFTACFGVGISTFFPNGMGLLRRFHNLTAFEQSFFSVAAAIGNGVVPAVAGWLFGNSGATTVSSNESPLYVTAVTCGFQALAGFAMFLITRAHMRDLQQQGGLEEPLAPVV